MTMWHKENGFNKNNKRNFHHSCNKNYSLQITMKMYHSNRYLPPATINKRDSSTNILLKKEKLNSFVLPMNLFEFHLQTRSKNKSNHL